MSKVALVIKNRVQSLCWKDPLEKGMATHSSILAWEIQGQRSLAGYSPLGRKRVRHKWAHTRFISFPLTKRIPLHECIHIQFPVNEYWYCVHAFAIMSNTAMSFTHLLVHVYKHLLSLVYIQRNGTADIWWLIIKPNYLPKFLYQFTLSPKH